ncbi:MAG: alpha-glucan family phosphorylase [Bryobacteraceae bacterium]
MKEILVRPAVPDSLSRIHEIAYNLMWSWDHTMRAMFRRLDPVIWKTCNRNPITLLARVSQQTLERSAADPRYLAVYKRACESLDLYMKQAPAIPNRLIAYFSMEYGLLDCLQIYSGGLGVLSGDHLKSASDANIPLVGVGLLYQKGYLEQSLNPDGWQQERTPVNDFYSLPVLPVTREDGSELIVYVTLPSGRVAIKVWRVNVGRVRLIALDTNIPQNEAENRDITDHLYGGDSQTRIRQEIVLGIGGLRALREMGLEPTVFHMNEGHSAFLSIERIRVLMRESQLSFDEALSASRTNNVFTTHTSVPAGIDLFDTGLMYQYFADYCRDAGIAFERLLELGRRNPEDSQEPFSMAITAIKASSYRNAVSRLHRQVSQDMWQELWPKLPTWEVPITSVTNGVHLPTWVNGDLATIYDHYLPPDWRERHTDPKVWDMLNEIPDQELWEAHRRRKRRLVQFVRERVGASAAQRKATSSEIRHLQEVLDPEALTLGFARRFATYKRATLVFRDLERLKSIVNHPRGAVQIVISGKAHPKDNPGKTFIREIVQWAREAELEHRVVFLEDYSIHVARELVQSVDVWLNTPRRGEEACGTSGMKAGLNGVLNMSILDGWWDEAYEQAGGWAIGDRVPYSADQDDLHASSIYSLLENEIVPMYYAGASREGGVSEEWMRRVRQSIQHVSTHFNCQRMVEEYDSELYAPAHDAFQRMKTGDFAPARQRMQWSRDVERAWDSVRFLDVGPPPDAAIVSGTEIHLRAAIDLAGLRPEDVRVEALFGRIGIGGELEDTEVLTLDSTEQNGTVFTFSRQFVPHQTGRLGYGLRISTNHYTDPLTRPCNPLLKWAGD